MWYDQNISVAVPESIDMLLHHEVSESLHGLG